jgi:hypothetical protein
MKSCVDADARTHISLSVALPGGKWSASRWLTSGRTDPVTHCNGDCVALTADLSAMVYRKFSGPCQEQPVIQPAVELLY